MLRSCVSEEPGRPGSLRLSKSLTAAEVVFAATARAHRYLVSRSMTSMEMSRAMAREMSAPFIVPPFSGGTTPEPTGQEAHP